MRLHTSGQSQNLDSAMLPALQLWAKHDQFLRKADHNAPLGFFQCLEQDLAVHAKRFAVFWHNTAQLTAFLTKTQQGKRERKSSSHILISFFSPFQPLLLLKIPKHRSHDEGSIPIALCRAAHSSVSDHLSCWSRNRDRNAGGGN